MMTEIHTMYKLSVSELKEWKEGFEGGVHLFSANRQPTSENPGPDVFFFNDRIDGV